MFTETKSRKTNLNVSLGAGADIKCIIISAERVASCEKKCERVTPLLQLAMFFSPHRCKLHGKLPRVTWPLHVRAINIFKSSQGVSYV